MMHWLLGVHFPMKIFAVLKTNHPKALAIDRKLALNLVKRYKKNASKASLSSIMFKALRHLSKLFYKLDLLASCLLSLLLNYPGLVRHYLRASAVKISHKKKFFSPKNHLTLFFFFYNYATYFETKEAPVESRYPHTTTAQNIEVHGLRKNFSVC